MSIQDRLELIKLGIRSVILQAKLRIRALLFSHMRNMEMLERQVKQLEDQMSSLDSLLWTDKLSVISLLNSRFWKYDVRFYLNPGKTISLYALDLNSKFLETYPITWDLAHKILRTPSDKKAAKLILDTSKLKTPEEMWDIVCNPSTISRKVRTTKSSPSKKRK